MSFGLEKTFAQNFFKFAITNHCLIILETLSLRKGQERYQWRLAEVRCLLVENYSNSRQVWSSRSFLQFLGGLRPNDLIVFILRHVLFICSVIISKVCRHIGLSTVLTQDHFYSDWCIYKLQRSPLLFLRWCLSACELLGSCRLASTWWHEKRTAQLSSLLQLTWHGFFYCCFWFIFTKSTTL